MTHQSCLWWMNNFLRNFQQSLVQIAHRRGYRRDIWLLLGVQRNKLRCWEALYFSVRLTLAMTDSNLFSNKDPLGRCQTVSHEEQYPCSEDRLLSTSMDAHVICWLPVSVYVDQEPCTVLRQPFLESQNRVGSRYFAHHKDDLTFFIQNPGRSHLWLSTSIIKGFYKVFFPSIYGCFLKMVVPPNLHPDPADHF